jgi:hypothetical protein
VIIDRCRVKDVVPSASPDRDIREPEPRQDPLV